MTERLNVKLTEPPKTEKDDYSECLDEYEIERDLMFPISSFMLEHIVQKGNLEKLINGFKNGKYAQGILICGKSNPEKLKRTFESLLYGYVDCEKYYQLGKVPEGFEKSAEELAAVFILEDCIPTDSKNDPNLQKIYELIEWFAKELPKGYPNAKLYHFKTTQNSRAHVTRNIFYSFIRKHHPEIELLHLCDDDDIQSSMAIAINSIRAVNLEPLVKDTRDLIGLYEIVQKNNGLPMDDGFVLWFIENHTKWLKPRKNLETYSRERELKYAIMNFIPENKTVPSRESFEDFQERLAKRNANKEHVRRRRRVSGKPEGETSKVSERTEKDEKFDNHLAKAITTKNLCQFLCSIGLNFSDFVSYTMTDEDHLNAIWGKVYNLNCPNGLNTDLNTLRVQGEDAFKYLSVSSKILFLNDMKIPNLFPLLYEPSFRYEDGTAEASHTMCISMFQRMLSSIGIQTRHEKTSTNDFILQSFFRTARETKHPDEVSIYVFSDDLIESLKVLSERSLSNSEQVQIETDSKVSTGSVQNGQTPKIISKVSEPTEKNEKIMRFFSTYSRRYVYDVQDNIESPESLSIPFYCLAENDFKKYLAIGNIQDGNNDIIQIALLKDFILDHWYLIDEVVALNIDVFFCVLANKCSDEDEDVPLYEAFYDESSDPVNRKYYDDLVSAEKSKIGTETIKSLILPGINFLNNHKFKYLSDPDPSPGKKKLKLNIFDPFAEPSEGLEVDQKVDPEEHYSYAELTEDHDDDDDEDSLGRELREHDVPDLRGVFDSDHEERLEPESFEMIRLRFQFMLYLIRTIMTQYTRNIAAYYQISEKRVA